MVYLGFKHNLGGGFNFFYFHPFLWKWSNLTIFQMGWNHQLATVRLEDLGPRKNQPFQAEVDVPLSDHQAVKVGSGYTHDGSMGRRVYLPTWMVDFDGYHVGKYTIFSMDATGYLFGGILSHICSLLTFGWNWIIWFRRTTTIPGICCRSLAFCIRCRTPHTFHKPIIVAARLFFPCDHCSRRWETQLERAAMSYTSWLNMTRFM